eukprot:scaffold122837_cov78-Phaeocystis_antarctica.AAC.2
MQAHDSRHAPRSQLHKISCAPTASKRKRKRGHLDVQQLQQLGLLSIQHLPLLAHSVVCQQRHHAVGELRGQPELTQVGLHGMRKVERARLEADVPSGGGAGTRVLCHLCRLEASPHGRRRLVREEQPGLAAQEHAGDLTHTITKLVRRGATKGSCNQLIAPEEDAARLERGTHVLKRCVPHVGGCEDVQ